MVLGFKQDVNSGPVGEHRVTRPPPLLALSGFGYVSLRHLFKSSKMSDGFTLQEHVSLMPKCTSCVWMRRQGLSDELEVTTGCWSLLKMKFQFLKKGQIISSNSCFTFISTIKLPVFNIYSVQLKY